MPLLDIAIAHSSARSYLGYTRVQLFIDGNIPNSSVLQHDERWTPFRNSLHYTRNLNFGLVHFKKSYPGFLVSAVATLEPKLLVQDKDRETNSNVLPSTAESGSAAVQTHSSSEDPMHVDEREKLRRMRISKANKGNTPWNKGRKHSPETVRRIRERTRLAMQSPKVKMKLATMGHAQSTETRVKIAIGVRIGWQKRREKLLLQETCLFDWQNLIAEAARGGFQEEEELQWDSYDTLNKQLKQEWLDSIEHRKSLPRPKGSKRAPKSLEQRRKIAEAIAAKWADPAYRSRVESGLAKYHKIPEGAERKRRKKPKGEDTGKTFRKKSDNERSGANDARNQSKLKKKSIPKFKDPLAKTKLEMLKNIRAQRVAPEAKKNEALERAKLLISEAQKAAKALEVAAIKSPVARASLIEAQKLIAEATRSIESIENGNQDDSTSGHQDYVDKGGETLVQEADQRYYVGVNGLKEAMTADVDQRDHKMVNGMGDFLLEEFSERHHKRVNGVESLRPGEGRYSDSDLYKTIVDDELDQNHQLPTIPGGYKRDPESFIEKMGVKECLDQQYPESNGSPRLNGVSTVNGVKLQSHDEHAHPAAKTVTKKWVRGRLVEVAEGE